MMTTEKSLEQQNKNIESYKKKNTSVREQNLD